MTTEFKITEAERKPVSDREAILANPGFGKGFTDHMVSVVWEQETGWQQPEILPYGPLLMDPASSVLHYGQEIFEGLKAYRRADGSIALFRPEQNAERLRQSARRMALPEVPVDLFVDSVTALVEIDKDWVPGGDDQTLYIRPFLIADESFLGVRSAQRVRFLIIASPSGAYFAGGLHPVSIWLSNTLSRAGSGGTGSAKCGGNYASSLLPQNIAAENGCDQVLFTDGADNDRIDELGGMNFFLVRNDNTLITPELNGNILPGITRASLIQLAKDRGLTVEERRVGVNEWISGVQDGSIIEAFACGTAAVITPIGSLHSEDGLLVDYGERAPGELTMSLRNELTGIQYGDRTDPHEWVTVAVPAET
ncbi:MAG: branched-chain amino acid aminotransferase [Canibacter sp.]